MTAVTIHRPTQTAAADMLSDPAQFELAQRWANAFAASQLVPGHLRGKPADCLIGLMMAKQIGDNPLTVLQNIYIVGGKAGWSATYMIARANQSGVFRGRITWDEEGAGQDLTVTAKATLAETGEEIRIAASMQMAKAEGWTKNQKYQTMPAHMLRWRSATMLVRLYCPEVMLGMATADELEDVSAAAAPARAAMVTTLDAFAAEAETAPADAEPVEGDAPLDARAFNWHAWAEETQADLTKYSDADKLDADWSAVKERMMNDEAPEDIRAALTTAYLTQKQSLGGRKR